MAESEQAHRHEQQTKLLKLEEDSLMYEARDSRMGMVSGLVFTLFTLGAVVVCAVIGHPIAASVVGATGVTGGIAVFVNGRQKRNKKDDNDDADGSGD